MTTDADAELDRLAEAELRRREAPPYRPHYELIVCIGCGRRLTDDDGRNIHPPWWQFWKWGC